MAELPLQIEIKGCDRESLSSDSPTTILSLAPYVYFSFTPIQVCGQKVALRILPTLDRDKVGDKAWNVALEQRVVAQDDSGSEHIDGIIL